MNFLYFLRIACLNVSMFFVFKVVFAQSKIKDGSVTDSVKIAPAGVLLELESVNQGFLLPRLTTQQRNAIAPSNLTTGLLIFNATSECIDYWSVKQGHWLSLRGQPEATIDTLQCSKTIVYGVYKQHTALTNNNHLSVMVTVSHPGSYVISATTTSGYTFRGAGNFAANGEYTVNLVGIGSPNAVTPDGGAGDEVTIAVNGINSNCKLHIKVAAADVAYKMACNTSVVNGRYMIGMPLTAGNTLTLPVNVTEPGAYAIKSDTLNGYYFAGSGTFTTTGEQKVILKGNGTPSTAGINNFTLTSNSAVNDTSSGLTVSIPAVAYTANCNEAVIKGTYRRNVVLTADNTITLPVTVTATGPYSITTDNLNGMTFAASGVFKDTGSQQVVLTGAGTPVTNGNYTVTISTNSSKASDICQVAVNVQLRTIRVLGVGYLGFQPGGVADDETARAVLISTANFGPNGKVVIAGINIINSNLDLPDLTTMSQYDIVVIGCCYYPDANARAKLVDFVKNKKGVVLNFSDGNNMATADLANALYGTNNIVRSSGDGAGATYQLADFDDPVLNGSFGDIHKKYWGQDGSPTDFLGGLPDDVIVYSRGNAKTGAGNGGVSCFRHATLGYLWAADGGFIGGKNDSSNMLCCPAVNNNGNPQPKYYGSSDYGGPVEVYNSVFYANAMEWAIKYVLEHNP